MTGGNAKSPGLTRRAISSGLPGQLQPEPANPHRVRLLELAADYEKSGHGWFWSTGPDGKLSYVSECVSQVLGKAVDQLVGQPLRRQSSGQGYRRRADACGNDPAACAAAFSSAIPASTFSAFSALS